MLVFILIPYKLYTKDHHMELQEKQKRILKGRYRYQINTTFVAYGLVFKIETPHGKHTYIKQWGNTLNLTFCYA